MAHRKPRPGEVEYKLLGGMYDKQTFIGPDPVRPKGREVPAAVLSWGTGEVWNGEPVEYAYERTSNPKVYRLIEGCTGDLLDKHVEAEVQAEFDAQKAAAEAEAYAQAAALAEPEEG